MGANDTNLSEVLQGHYRRVTPLLESIFGAIPTVTASCPNGLDTPAVWHPTALPLTSHVVEWCVTKQHAVEFHSWMPRTDRKDRLAYARILLEPGASVYRAMLNEAARLAREALAAHHLDAIAVLDGQGGIALFLPFDDAPAYDDVRAWLHGYANDLAAAHGSLFSTEPNSRDENCVHIHVSHNAIRSWSILPYSARGLANLPVALPIAWDELDADLNVTVATLDQRLQSHGDVFARERARIGSQTFASLQRSPQLAVASHGHVIDAALHVLLDGRTRSADQILADAIAQGLLPSNFNKRYVYTALIEYIARAQGNGRRPAIVQDAQRSFRFNEPADDWPDLPNATAPVPDAQAEALAKRLADTANGNDPAAFELAVCDGFAHLGFAAAHLGGNKAPDGCIDAQLGALGYRVMLECKTAKTTVTQPDAFEAAKYRDAFNAQFCVLIGPAFPDEVELTQELHTHGVSAWTVDDLRGALLMNANAYELRNAFVPGYAADALTDLRWERTHGAAKHVAVIVDILSRVGRQLQETAAKQGGPTDAPMLTVDTAMALVDRELAAAGSTQACTREQVEAAFRHVTDPMVGGAVYTADGSAIIVTALASG